MADRHDPGMDLPLAGVQLVEASAGTGKTFALATLYARGVIEAKLPVDALLAVTFTDAATAELRTRIRERLALAHRLAGGTDVDPDDAAQVLTARLVQAALDAGEPLPALRARLRAATEAMDLAPVLTIHRFCRRALAEHALDAGHVPGEVELVANERPLREEVATDLWRAITADRADADSLVTLWKSPAALAEGLVELWSVDVLRPPPVPADVAGETAARARQAVAAAALATACADLGEDTCAQIRAAIAAGALSATTHKSDRVERLWPVLAAWSAAGCDGDAPDAGLAIFGSTRLADAVKKAFVGKVAMPRNPLTEAIEAWFTAAGELAAFVAARRVALVHRIRDEGRARLLALKRQRRLQGFDDLIRDLAEALDGPSGEALAQRLRAQYRVALVDEFQDTDPRQWAIFRRVFQQAPADGAVRALFLIGDPKQAIYRFRGGDVFTYLDAAATADGGGTLECNFRSRPLALQAVQALYAGAGTHPFGQADIAFQPVKPGGRVADDAFELDGAPAPALELLTWDDPDGTPSAGDARDRAATACVARIRDLLQPARAAIRRDGGLHPVTPGDIAVLVARHSEAQLMQRLLARAGVPSVAAGRDSLYASDEADDLLRLFAASLHLSDDGRLRAALATPLLGQDASAIAALDDDGERHRGWQDQALGWRQRWERSGPLALVADLCAAAAPRVLALAGGERQLANWLQLAESLQADSGGRPPAAVAALLGERIAAADGNNEEEQMRLESDAARVSILTLHRSKGLEFPLVFLPFLSHPPASRPTRGPALARFHEDGARVGLLRIDEADWKPASALDKAEIDGEQRRLVYVGLTRARLATWIGFGPANGVTKSAFAALLFDRGDGVGKELGAAAIRARLDAIAASAPDAIVVGEGAALLPPGAPPLAAPAPLPPAASPQRRLERDWSLHSFSALTREAGGSDARRAGDETETVQAPNRFAGARFGNVLHEALENVDFAAWDGWRGDAPPPGQLPPLEAALRNGGWGSAADVADGVALLATLVRDTLNAPLPEGTRLAALAQTARRAELEFHFALAPAQVDTLLALLHAHGLLAARSGFGARTRLEGLLTGFVDLVYEHAGRIYVLDYKSNWLPAYDDAGLAEAMAHGEYDLQYLLYTLALHRWLRFRNPGYDYERDFGGVRYLFCRGLGDGGGVYAVRPPFALVDALDTLLRHVAPEVA